MGQSLISLKENGHRIEFLTQTRNAAMEPLYSGEAVKGVPGKTFKDVLFMNDIHFCAVDMLEVIYQKRIRGANANEACTMDWGRQVVYD